MELFSETLMERPSGTTVISKQEVLNLLWIEVSLYTKAQEVLKAFMATPWPARHLLSFCPVLINIYFLPSLLDASQGEEEKQRASTIPLREWPRNCTHGLFSYPTGQNLIT